MESKFWAEDFSTLFRSTAFLPNCEMNDAEKLNALTRLIVIVTAILYLTKNKYFWTFLVVGILVVFSLYYVRDNSTVETFVPDRFGSNMPRDAAITPIIPPHIFGNSFYNAQFPTFGHTQPLPSTQYGGGSAAPHPFELGEVPNYQATTHLEVADSFGGYAAPHDRPNQLLNNPNTVAHFNRPMLVNQFENYGLPQSSHFPVVHDNLNFYNTPQFQTQSQILPSQVQPLNFGTYQESNYGFWDNDPSGQVVNYGSSLDYPSNAPVVGNLPPGSMFTDDVYDFDNFSSDRDGYDRDDSYFEPQSHVWRGVDYLGRSNVDHLSEVHPINMFQASTNAGAFHSRGAVEDSFTDHALQFRGAMINQYIAKKENERHDRRRAPVQRGARR